VDWANRSADDDSGTAVSGAIDPFVPSFYSSCAGLLPENALRQIQAAECIPSAQYENLQAELSARGLIRRRSLWPLHLRCG
jgi:hypothetical protein